MTITWLAVAWFACCAAAVAGYVVGRAFGREEHISLQLEAISLRGLLDRERIRVRELVGTVATLNLLNRPAQPPAPDQADAA